MIRTRHDIGQIKALIIQNARERSHGLSNTYYALIALLDTEGHTEYHVPSNKVCPDILIYFIIRLSALKKITIEASSWLGNSYCK